MYTLNLPVKKSSINQYVEFEKRSSILKTFIN